MKLDPGIHIAMHSVLSLKPGVTFSPPPRGTILRYADDTILFLEDVLVKANNLKQVLCAFENLSSLKINFHKSGLFSFGKTKKKGKLLCEFVWV